MRWRKVIMARWCGYSALYGAIGNGARKYDPQVPDDSEIVAAVVARLRKSREERGVSQYRLAKETGLSASGIRHMENGRVNPTLYFVLRICRFLEIDLSDLIREAEKSSLAAKKECPGAGKGPPPRKQ